MTDNPLRLGLWQLAQVLLPVPGRYVAVAGALLAGADYDDQLQRLRELEWDRTCWDYGRWVEVWRHCAAGEVALAQDTLARWMGLELPPVDAFSWFEPASYVTWLGQQGLDERTQQAVRLLLAGDVVGFYGMVYPQLAPEDLQLVAQAMSLPPVGVC